MEDRLRVGMFTNVYRPTVNGVVVSVDAFRKGLRRRGHDVFVFAPHASDFDDTQPYIFRYPGLELPVQKYPLAVPVSRTNDRVLKVMMPHVLHANHPALLGNVAAQKSKELNVPLVFTYHTRYRQYAHYANLLPEHLVQDFIENWLAHFMLKCHHVVVPSQSIFEMVRDNYGIKRGVSVVSTGVDLKRFQRFTREEARRHLGLEGTLLISSGRLAKEKNFEFLIRSLAPLAPEFPDLKLVILGEGDERPTLERLIRDSGMQSQIELPGLVSPRDVPAYLAAADLFVFSSVTETQGLVTLEAMASGLPVAAVDASGTSDVVVNEENGFLVGLDESAFAGAVRELLQDASLRQRFGERSRELASNYGYDSQAEKMEQAYRQAMKTHAKGGTVLLDNENDRNRFEEMLSFFKPQPR